MKYYKVVIGDKHDYFTGHTTILNELLTEKERHIKFRYLQDNCFKIVEISRKKTHIFFGARFEND